MKGQHSSPQNTVPVYAPPVLDTTTLTSTLANPYAQHYAPHYYQAYMQAYANGPPRTTSDGYTLSSTYVPGTSNQTSRAALPPRERPPAQAHTINPIRNHLTYGSWYQPGNCRCARQGCSFTGSRKSVEIHMMDRHLVFPPGWERKDDWDADPSLKGKPIAIQGTSLMLDTPEAIDAWIAERKRRFPTDARVHDKKRKLEEAAARGQLAPEDMGVCARKKQRQQGGACARGGHRGLLRDRQERGSACREERRAKFPEGSTSRPVDAQMQETGPKSESVTDDDGAPEVVSSKIPSPPSCIPNVGVDHKSAEQALQVHPRERIRKVVQPKRPPRNPFATRSTLLRNLLLPEIRVTVSNLSQAIHFLAENDFLRGVELQPGEARDQMIEVLESTETSGSAELHPTNAADGV